LKLHRHLVVATVEAVAEIFGSGGRADQVVEAAMTTHPKWGARDRRQFAESVYEIVRWWRWFWYLADLPDGECLHRGSGLDAGRVWKVWAVYRVTLGEEVPDYPECGGVAAAEVRRREQAEVSPAIRAALPDWMDAAGAEQLGAGWPGLREALNRPAEVFLRLNTLKLQGVDALRSVLLAEGVETEPVPAVAGALRLATRRNVTKTQAYARGLFEVQDAASQAIAPFLRVEPGQFVIDACAGAGGKTLHLAALMGNHGRLLAMDIHERKLAELRRRAARGGVTCVETKRVGKDGKEAGAYGAMADRVLLDVPCSGLGVLRRQPETKWKFREKDLADVLALQAELLARYAAMAKPGGMLVYATCSVLPSENERQIAAFLGSARGGEWELEEERMWRPDRDGFDGFYAARLARR